MSSVKKPKKVKYKAVIIGAGRIGAQFDFPKSKEILTHAHAYYKHPKVKLMGFFDVNKGAAKKAAKKWGCNAYFDLTEMFKNEKPDIVSICTPDKFHYPVLLKVVKYKPKIVICEKPITISLEHTRKIIKFYKKAGVSILINYPRRFDKKIHVIKKAIDEGRYGKILCASGIYTKGILHNGSHLIDLCYFLFGKMKKAAIFYKVDDYNRSDKSVAGFIGFEKCEQFHLLAGDERNFSVFYLDIIFEKKRVVSNNFGFDVYEQEVVRDPLYVGYKCLGRIKEAKTSLSEAMINLINNAIRHVEEKAPLVCGVEDAFRVQEYCLSLLKKKRIL